MKYYYFYIPSDIARSGAMFLVFFIIFSIFFLLIVINFRFRVNRTRKKTKNESKPLIYIIPKHVDHAKKYIDPTEYYAFKAMIFNENEGHFMRKNVDTRKIKYPKLKKKRVDSGKRSEIKNSFLGNNSLTRLVARNPQEEENLDSGGSFTGNTQVSKFYGQSYRSLRRVKVD